MLFGAGGGGDGDVIVPIDTMDGRGGGGSWANEGRVDLTDGTLVIPEVETLVVGTMFGADLEWVGISVLAVNGWAKASSASASATR